MPHVSGEASRCVRCYDVLMRTTIDLPEDLHRLAKAIAHDQGLTLSAAVVALLRRALGQNQTLAVTADPATGLPSVRIGRTITSEDVRSLEEEA